MRWQECIGCSLAFIMLLLPHGEAQSAPPPAGVWLVDNHRLWQIDDAGRATLKAPSDRQLRAVATDLGRGLVWSFGGAVLARHDLSGTLTRSLALPVPAGNGNDQAWLELDPSSGTVWLLLADRLLIWSAAGELLRRIDLKGKPRALAVPGPAAWLALRDALMVIAEPDQPPHRIELAPGTAVLDLALAAQRLWLAGRHELQVRDLDGRLLHRLDLRVEHVVPARDGGVWAASKRRLYRLAPDATPLWSVVLGGSGSAVALSAAPDGSVWVAYQQRLEHYSADGDLLLDQRLTGAGQPGRVWDLDVGRDGLSPQLAFISPSDGASLNQLRPVVQLQASDDGLGLDPASLQLSIDGQQLAIDCDHVDQRFECRPLTALAEGGLTMQAHIADRAGNVSAPARLALTLDVTPPHITIDAPADGSHRFGGQLDLLGHLSESASLEVNGQAVTPAPDLSFRVPTDLPFGPYNWTLLATDRAGNQARHVHGVVRERSVPVLTVPGSHDVVAGQLFSLQLIASDPDPDDRLSFELIDAPLGMWVDPDSGLLSWSSSQDDTGMYQIIARVSDLNGDADQAVWEVTVLPSQLPPVAQALSLQTEENQALDLVLQGHDPNGDPISFEVTAAPRHGSLHGTAPQLRYLPPAFFEGRDEFIFVVDDGELVSEPARVSIEVLSHGNNPPRILSEPITHLALDSSLGAPVQPDFRHWTVSNFPPDGHAQAPNWEFSAGGAVAIQTNNAYATRLLGDFESANTQITGSWRATEQRDDDAMGFVFAHQDAYHFYLFSWKRGLQDGIPGGMQLRLIDLDPAAGIVGYSPQAGSAGRLLYSNFTGWRWQTDYDYRLDFRPGLIRIQIESAGEVIESIAVADSTLTSGAFGLFNHSQEGVEYRAQIARRDVSGGYHYPLVASDPDGDVLSYRLEQAPPGLHIDPDNGQISWAPQQVAIGRHRVVVAVADSHGATVRQAFDLQVGDEVPVFPPQDIPPAFAGEDFRHLLVALAPNPAVSLSYSLLRGPEGLTLDLVTGELRWPPSAFQIGTHSLTIEIVASNDVSLRRDLTIHVARRPPNSVPEFVGSPPTQVVAGGLFRYRPQTTDADGDEVFVRVVQAPWGAQLFNGRDFIWFPTVDDVGRYPVTLEADDPNGGVTRQDFEILVIDQQANGPPRIVSSPPTTAQLGSAWHYRVQAEDPDGDQIRFELVSAPTNLTLDAAGRLDWTPAAAGLREVVIRARDPDGSGGHHEQRFTIAVNPSSGNRAPRITSVPVTRIRVDEYWSYRVTAADPDGDPLSFSSFGPVAGAGLNRRRELSWSAHASLAGRDYPVTIEVRDPAGAVARQSFRLYVESRNRDPAFASVPTTVAAPGLPYSYMPSVSDADSDPLSFALAGAPVGMRVDPVTGAVSWTPAGSQLGDHDVRLEVSDGQGGLGVQEFSLHVSEGAGDSVAPVIGALSPVDGSEITAPVAVEASIEAVDLAHWRLSLISGEPGAGPQVLASGTQGFARRTIAEFDPTLLYNGHYRLVLEATDTSGNVARSDAAIEVTGAMKVGPFAIAFEDLSIPLAGIPITITRNYDTRQRRQALAFGQGWSVGYQAMRLFESRTTGFSWRQAQEGGGAFPDACVRPNGQRQVMVRMPDGQIERFSARAEPQCRPFGAGGDVQLVYDPLGQTTSTLEQLDFGLLRVVAGQLVDAGAPTTPVDPRRYRLTTRDGFRFELDQGYTLTRVTDPNDNVLRFTASGIEHSSGQSVRFERDGQGRISRIVAPDGTSISYGYDAAGNLQAVTDQLGQRTVFSYDADHRLSAIIDPLGNPIARNEYDAQGRLIAHLDASGHRIEYQHDIAGRRELVRDRRGNPSSYVYDDRGYVSSRTDALGHTTAWTHDQFGNELSRTDPLGQQTRWTYDARGNRLSETNPLGQTTRFSYSDFDQLLSETAPDGTLLSVSEYANRHYPPRAGNLVGISDALGHTTRFDYDASGSLVRLTDAQGQQTQYVYDLFGRRHAETAPNGRVTTFDYDDNGNTTREVSSQTRADGSRLTLVTSFDYDERGRQVGVTDALGQVTRTEYNANDKVSAEIDPLGRRTEYVYDERGQRVLTRYPDGLSEAVAYDENGNEISRTDRAGRITRMVYDAADRLIETIHPDGSSNRNDYDAAGRLTSSTDERGHVSHYEYDAAGRRIASIDALRQSTQYSYDARGNRIKSTDPLGRTTVFHYDLADRLVRTHHADGSTSATGYDALGRRLKEIDQARRTTDFEYDPAGNLNAVIDARGQRTEYAYDEQSNKLSQRDAQGRVTRWDYDELGRVTSRTLPLGQREYFSYDPAGNRTARQDFNGAQASYQYDPLNRLVHESYADGTVISTSYTPSGQPADIIDARGLTRHLYDARDRLTRIDYPSGKSIDYQYDPAGNRTQVSSQAGTISYHHDPLNRLSTVHQAGTQTTYHYDPAGNLTQQTHANETVAQYDYDPLNRLTRISHHSPAGQLISQQTYTLGPAGHRQAIEDHDGRHVAYGYDELYRLISETVSDPMRTETQTQWSYDATGNRLAQRVCQPRCDSGNSGGSEVLTQYSYDANDRLLESFTDELTPQHSNWSYDNNGNTIRKTEAGAQIDYHYDSRDRLVGASSSNAGLGGATTASFEYDPTGIRQAKILDGLRTDFLIDPNRPYAQVLAEIDANGQVTVAYSYGTDLLSQTQGGSTSTYHHDGLGTVRALSDEVGERSDSYVFGAFGGLEDASGSTENNYLFAGEQFDAELGLYYLRARYMDPGVGRFHSMDEWPGVAGRPISLNKFLYANGDPVIVVDPSGMFGLHDVNAVVGAIGRGSARFVAVPIYAGQRFAMQMGMYQVAILLQGSGAGVYRLARMHPALLRLHAGQVWEKLLNPAIRLLGGRRNVVIRKGGRIVAKPDWVIGRSRIIDAKLGVHLNRTQLGHYLSYAASNGGRVTYVTLVKPPPNVIADATALGVQRGVSVNFVTFLPF